MRLSVVADADALARAVADAIADATNAAVAARGRAAVAFSGGRTPAPMLRLLAAAAVSWDAVTVFQVDERVAPDGAAARNATMLARELLDHVPATAHLMPVTTRPLTDAAATYAQLVQRSCAGLLDVVHLGLGADGHTASLVPGDPVVEEESVDVAVTGVYEGHRRMTMTLPLLNRARAIVWEVAGAAKEPAVTALLRGDDIPAARVNQAGARLFVDAGAAPQQPSRG